MLSAERVNKIVKAMPTIRSGQGEPSRLTRGAGRSRRRDVRSLEEGGEDLGDARQEGFLVLAERVDLGPVDVDLS